MTNPANGHEYALWSGPGTWVDAFNATPADAHLVTFSSAEEEAWVWNTFLPAMAPSPNTPPEHRYRFWIGFTDSEEYGGVECNFNDPVAWATGKWVWVTGEPVTYTNWWRFLDGTLIAPNQLGDEDFAETLWPLDPTKYTGNWNDMPRQQLWCFQSVFERRDGYGNYGALAPPVPELPPSMLAAGLPLACLTFRRVRAATRILRRGGHCLAILLVGLACGATPSWATLTWVTNAANGHEYAFWDGQGSWTTAFAATPGDAHLVTFADAAEETWVWETFHSLVQGRPYTIDQAYRFWIGLTDSEDYGATEGCWRWVTGEPVTYTNWQPYEPNNHLNEDFAESMARQPYSWTGWWNDLSADSSHCLQAVFERGDGYSNHGAIAPPVVPELPPTLLVAGLPMVGLYVGRLRRR